MADEKQHVEDLEKLLDVVRDQRRKEVRKALEEPAHIVGGQPKITLCNLQAFVDAIKGAIEDERSATPPKHQMMIG